MVPLDRALKPELINRCKEDVQLSDEIERKRKELNLKGGILCLRAVMKMVYSNLASDKNMLEICTIRSLADVRYEDFGDKSAPAFWHKFLTVLQRMENPLDMEHRRDMLHTELKKSPGMKLSLVRYTDTATKDRTYEQLADIFNKWMAETKEERNLAAEMGDFDQPRKQRRSAANYRDGKDGDGGKNGGKKGDGKKGGQRDNSCYECGGPHWIRDCPKLKDRPEGKGKGKGKGKGGKTKLTDQQRAETLCTFYQVKWLGGVGCKDKTCKFKHVLAGSQEEADKLYKPYSLSRQTSAANTPRDSALSTPRTPKKQNTPVPSPKSSPRGSKSAGKGKKKNTFHLAANYNMFCRHGPECGGRAPPDGDGSCERIHCSKSEADHIIRREKEKIKNAGE